MQIFHSLPNLLKQQGYETIYARMKRALVISIKILDLIKLLRPQ